MEIKRINVSEYSRNDEYPGLETPLDGATTLLYGSNVTGKTVTFCALSHAVVEEPMTVRPGNGASVGIGFTDGSHLHRGVPATTFTTDRHDTDSENVRARMDEVLGNRPILQTYFLHSETSELPLSKLETDEILDVVRSVTVPDLQGRIAQQQTELQECKNRQEEVTDERREVESRIEETNERIDTAETDRDEAQNVLRLDTTGELETIRNALEQQEEAADELDDLLARRQEVQEELDDAKNREEELQSKLIDPIDQVARSVEQSESCPICDETVSREDARDRIEDDRCPLCAQENSIEDYREQFDQAKRAAESEIEGVQSEKNELKEKRDELDEEIEVVREQQPELSAFDENVRRRLEDHDRELSAVVRDAREARDEAEDRLSNLRDELESLSEQRDRLAERQREVQSDIDEIRDTIGQLEGEARRGVETFTETWRRVLEEMTESIRRSLDITQEGIRVGGDSDRTYSSEDLSTSERHVLNLAFAVAVNETVDSERAGLDTLVVDEPFTHFDDDVRPEVLSFVLEDDERQYIFTSSDPSVRDRVPDEQCVRLEQSDVQWTLDDTDRMEDDESE